MISWDNGQSATSGTFVSVFYDRTLTASEILVSPELRRKLQALLEAEPEPEPVPVDPWEDVPIPMQSLRFHAEVFLLRRPWGRALIRARLRRRGGRRVVWGSSVFERVERGEITPEQGADLLAGREARGLFAGVSVVLQVFSLFVACVGLLADAPELAFCAMLIAALVTLLSR
jgi:hypothetical protein